METHQIEHGDIFILGSDGLWDNLYNIQILDLIRPFIRKSEVLADVELVAELIGKEASTHANMPNFISPFARQAHLY